MEWEGLRQPLVPHLHLVTTIASTLKTNYLRILTSLLEVKVSVSKVLQHGLSRLETWWANMTLRLRCHRCRLNHFTLQHYGLSLAFHIKRNSGSEGLSDCSKHAANQQNQSYNLGLLTFTLPIPSSYSQFRDGVFRIDLHTRGINGAHQSLIKWEKWVLQALDRVMRAKNTWMLKLPRNAQSVKEKGWWTTYLEDKHLFLKTLPEASSNFCLHPQLLLSAGRNHDSILSAMNSEVCGRACSVTERKQTVFNCLFDKHD